MGSSSRLHPALWIISEPSVYTNCSYIPETPNLGQNRRFFSLVTLKCVGWPWKNNRAPLQCPIKLCLLLHRHMLIQTWVTVRKQLKLILNSVTLIFDVWPISFAWASHLALAISPEHFMMMWWQKHCERSVTDRQANRQTYGRRDRQTEISVIRAAWSQLKKSFVHLWWGRLGTADITQTNNHFSQGIKYRHPLYKWYLSRQ